MFGCCLWPVSTLSAFCLGQRRSSLSRVPVPRSSLELRKSRLSVSCHCPSLAWASVCEDVLSPSPVTLSLSLLSLITHTLSFSVYISPSLWIFLDEPSDPCRQSTTHTRGLPSCPYPFACWFSAGQEVRRVVGPLLGEVVEHAGQCKVGGRSYAAVCQAFLCLFHHNIWHGHSQSVPVHLSAFWK